MSLAARIRLAQKRGLSLPAARTLARLATPQAIQDFLVDFPQNFEPEGDTARSVEQTLKHRRAHCIEGAMVAAFALWLQGHPPLLLDFSGPCHRAFPRKRQVGRHLEDQLRLPPLARPRVP
jgi:hypothetical protein